MTGMRWSETTTCTSSLSRMPSASAPERASSTSISRRKELLNAFRLLSSSSTKRTRILRSLMGSGAAFIEACVTQGQQDAELRTLTHFAVVQVVLSETGEVAKPADDLRRAR